MICFICLDDAYASYDVESTWRAQFVIDKHTNSCSADGMIYDGLGDVLEVHPFRKACQYSNPRLTPGFEEWILACSVEMNCSISFRIYALRLQIFFALDVNHAI